MSFLADEIPPRQGQMHIPLPELSVWTVDHFVKALVIWLPVDPIIQSETAYGRQ